MLEKIKGFFRTVNPKHVFRTVLAVATVVSVMAGYIAFDGKGVIYANSVHHVDTAFGDGHDVLDSTDISITDETEEETEKIESGVVLGPQLSGLYDLQPVTINISYETVNETIKHGYKTVKSSKLYKGETKTTKGENGEKEVVYCLTYVNGVLMSREAESEKVIKEAVAQVETVGTKLKTPTAVKTSDDVKCISTLKPSKPIELDKNGQPVSYKKVLNGKSSAYCGCCDSNSTAYFGPNSARPGYVAVNPKQIPYGTKLYIVSKDGKTVYGYAIAADTGGFAKNGSGRIVDLRMPTGSKCKCGSIWGVKNVNVYILG